MQTPSCVVLPARVNAMLKGSFLNIQHKFFRVFGLAKMTLPLVFTLAGYNLEATRSFLAKKDAERTAAPEEDQEEASQGDVVRRNRLKSTGVRPRPSSPGLSSSTRPEHQLLMKGVASMVW